MLGLPEAKQWCLEEKMRSQVPTFGEFLFVIKKWVGVGNSKALPFADMLESDLDDLPVSGQ